MRIEVVLQINEEWLEQLGRLRVNDIVQLLEKVIQPALGARAVILRIHQVGVGDSLFQAHSTRAKTCPICAQNCEEEALTSLVYVFDECTCSRAPFTHLVEQIYHLDCIRRIGWTMDNKCAIWPNWRIVSEGA